MPHKHLMRRLSRLRSAVAVLTILAAFPYGVTAQEKTQRWRVKDIRVGFTASKDVVFKSGLWTPVYVTIEQSSTGRLEFQVAPGVSPQGVLHVGAPDADGIEARFPTPFSLDPVPEKTLIGYACPGNTRPSVRCTINVGGTEYTLKEADALGLDLRKHLYLTLGSRMSALRDGMIGLSKDPKAGTPDPRYTAHIADLKEMPDKWFGYQAADLVILGTGNKEFIQNLARDKARIRALSQWVGQGGRLVFSVSWRNRGAVAAMLKSPAWRPVLPKIFAVPKHKARNHLSDVNDWLDARGGRFPATPEDPVQIAEFQPTKAVETLLQDGDDPIIMRAPYGRGNVTFVALELDRAPFTTWKAREAFWQTLVKRIGAKVEPPRDEKDQFGGPMGPGFHHESNDIGSQLHRELDHFEVPQISFGWVALFIFLFIVIVGPVDYLILRTVFKRLEWTWITFPSVVIIVTLAAYFTAYALKGDSQKINKIDLVDIDLRSNLDDEFKTARTYIYGTTWFSVLSPRIKDYTVAVEPVMGDWTKDGKGLNVGKDGMITWMGRAEEGGMGGIGRNNSTSLFRRSYDFADGGAAINNVPIPVWATKAFASSWTMSGKSSPIIADLSYDPNAINAENLKGTIQSFLPDDMISCHLIYGGNYYALKEAIVGKENGSTPYKFEIDGQRKDGFQRRGMIDQWAAQQHRNPNKEFDPWQEKQRQRFLPGALVKELYFLDKQTATIGNHLLRHVDQSWRIRSNRERDAFVRSAILVGRFTRAQGRADRLNSGESSAPSRLWIGETPKGENEPPDLPGSMIQETYIRVFLPVRPRKS